MPWRTLGTLFPNLLQWQTTPEASQGDVFRVLQDWDGDWPGTGFIQVSQIYTNGGRFGSDRIYPDRDPRIVLFPVPPQLSEIGLSERFFAVKLGSQARIYNGTNWRATIQEWVSDGITWLLSGGAWNDTANWDDTANWVD